MHRQKVHIRCSKKDRVRADVVNVIYSIITSEYQKSLGTVLIVIGGPGGTGKSSFSKELVEVLGDASIVRLDDYKISRRVRASLNIYGAHPDANEMELLAEHFEMLGKGLSIEKPVYNRDTGVADKTEIFTPKKYVILDGEVSTYKEFEKYIDFSIFIDSDWQTQLQTRLGRDLEDKNYDKEKAIATFLHSNIREFEAYGAATKNSADIHLYCESDYRLTLESMSEPLFVKFGSLLGGEYTRVGLKGLLLDIATPFSKDGSIDQGAFVEHLQYLHEIGVSRIFLGGYAGEFYLLTNKERFELLVAAARYFPGFISYNVTSLSLKEAKEKVQIAEELGADSVFALPPLAPVGIADSALERYYKELYEVADLGNMSMIISNSPRCSTNTLNKSVLKKLPKLYFKDGNRDSSLLNCSKKYLCGYDSRIAESVEKGGIGFITGASNAYPQLYLDMEEAITLNDNSHIEVLQNLINERFFELGEGGSIIHEKIKRAVSLYLPGYPSRSRSPYS